MRKGQSLMRAMHNGDGEPDKRATPERTKQMKESPKFQATTTKRKSDEEQRKMASEALRKKGQVVNKQNVAGAIENYKKTGKYTF